MTASSKLPIMLIAVLYTVSAQPAASQQTASPEDPQQEINTALPPGKPPAPADMPPSPPKVNCDGDKLTISAQNSTLGSVLNAVRTCTGAQVEVPEGIRGERFFGELGPGPVRAVLTEFLSSTDLDYVVQASPSDPQKVEAILLNTRGTDFRTEVASDTGNTGNVSPNKRAWLEARRNYVQSVSPPPDESSPESDAASSGSKPAETATVQENSPPVQSEPVTSAAAAPVVATDTTNETASPSSDQSATQTPSDKTSEMINSMRRLFEQRKQMSQPPSPQPPTVTP